MSDAVGLLPADAFNQQLLGHVHPPGWTNPTPAERYHLVVLGAGTAGLVTAAGAAGLGAKVALVERALMGGDCLNYGCVPSKGLIAAARAAAAVRDAGAFGVTVPAGVRVDFAAVMERMRRLRADISVNDSAERFRGLGVDVFLGQGQFSGPDTVAVGGKTLRFRKAVIATGAHGRPLRTFQGSRSVVADERKRLRATTELPPRLTVLGAGPIGCELAQAFARLGSQVTLCGNHAPVVPREDRDAAALVEQAFRHDGIELRLGAKVVRAERQGSEKS